MARGGLEERNEQLKAEKERLLYDVRRPGRPGRPLADDDRSAISREGCRRKPGNPTPPATLIGASQVPHRRRSRRPGRFRPGLRPAASTPCHSVGQTLARKLTSSNGSTIGFCSGWRRSRGRKPTDNIMQEVADRSEGGCDITRPSSKKCTRGWKC